METNNKLIKKFKEFINITPLQKKGYQNLHLNFLERVYKISFAKKYKCYAISNDTLYLFIVNKDCEKRYSDKIIKPYIIQKIHYWKNRNVSFITLGKKLQKFGGVYGKPLKVDDIDCGGTDWFLLKLKEDKDNGKKETSK